MKRIILTLSLLTLSFQLSAQKTLPDIAKAILQESFTIATDVLEANLAAGSLTLSKAEKEQQEKKALDDLEKSYAHIQSLVTKAKGTPVSNKADSIALDQIIKTNKEVEQQVKQARAAHK
jgi:hypothetical protein